jgi:hypothetical protein
LNQHRGQTLALLDQDIALLRIEDMKEQANDCFRWDPQRIAATRLSTGI